MTGGPADAVREAVAASIQAGAMPAAAWRVEEGGRTLSEGALGWAVVDPVREPVAAATPFDLASLTKPLATSFLAVVLEQEGLWDLDAPLDSLLPEIAASPYAGCTAVDMASHRAGLPAWAPLYVHAEDRAGYLAHIAASPPARPRGTTLYSDLGFMLLGFAAERAGGAPLDDLFGARIAGRLGCERIGFAAGPGRFALAAATERGNAFEARLAGDAGAGFPFRTDVIRGEAHDGNAWRLGGVAGHAGLFGTADDVVRIARAILDPPAGLAGRRWRSRWLEPVAGEGNRTVAFAPAPLSSAASGVLPDDAVGHNGFTGTSLWIEPRRGRIHVLLTNRVHPCVPIEDFAAVRRRFHGAATV